MFEMLHDWWCRLRGKPTPTEARQAAFERRKREQTEQQAAWLESLPPDLQAELRDVPSHEIGLLMETAALTPDIAGLLAMAEEAQEQGAAGALSRSNA